MHGKWKLPRRGAPVAARGWGRMGWRGRVRGTGEGVSALGSHVGFRVSVPLGLGCVSVVCLCVRAPRECLPAGLGMCGPCRSSGVWAGAGATALWRGCASTPQPLGRCPVPPTPRAALKDTWLLGPGLAGRCEGRGWVTGLRSLKPPCAKKLSSPSLFPRCSLPAKEVTIFRLGL